MRSNKACGLLMAATAAAMLMAGCQKDTVTLKARITPFGNDKVTMSGATPQWQDGDEVCVNSLEEITTISVSGSTATMQVLAAALYKAVYPAEYVTNTYGNEFDLLLPSKQAYATDNGSQVVKAPMGAYSQSKYLEFSPLGALLSININNNFTNDNNAMPDIVVDSVRVTALNGTHLWGMAIVENITASDHKYVMTGDTVGNNSILLTGEGEDAGMNMPIAHGSTGTCYVFIPEVNGERFAINVYAHDASGFRYAFSYEQAAGMSYSLGRADLASVGYSTADADCDERFVPIGAVDGRFTINSSGDQIFFSKGNLQWSYTGGGSTATSHNVNGGSTAVGTWRFALHQYDIIGNAAGNTTASNAGRDTQSDWIDLFQRGSSGYNDVTNSNYYAPYTMLTPACTTDMAGTYNDWGVYNAISNGGDAPNQWRTLTLDEWTYIFSTHTNKKATVAGVSGIILLPDNWSWDWDSDNSLLAIFNQNKADNRIFSDEQWRRMEKHGAVFLPNCGRAEVEHKNDNGGYDKVKEVKFDNNHYWTATTAIDGNKTKHKLIQLKDNGIETVDIEGNGTDKLKFLCAVRLVQNYVAPTTNPTSK